jgi:hypothetical protein
MADVNKTIEIQMKADIKQMLQQLKKIPGMTKEEAKKMVSGFQKELRQAQAAAKKAAAVNAKAMKKMGQSFDHAKRKARDLRKQSREVGGAFGALEDVVGEINPELAGVAMTLGTVGSAARTMARTIATGNPLIMGAVAAITAAIAAYTVFTTSQREAEQQQKLMNEALEETEKRFSTQADVIRGITSDYNKASRNLKVFRGEMQQVEADLLNAAEANEKSLQSDLQKQDEFIMQQKTLLQLAGKAKESAAALTEEETKQLNKAMLLTGEKRLASGISASQHTTTLDMFFLEQHLRKELGVQNKIRERIIEARKAELTATEELIELKAIEEQQDKQQAEEEKKRAKRQAEQQARTSKFLTLQNQMQVQNTTTTKELFKMHLATLEPLQRIEEEHQNTLHALTAQKNAIRQQFKEARDLAKTDTDRANLAQLEKQSKEQIAALNAKETALEAERAQNIHDALQDEIRAEEKRHKDKTSNLEKEMQLASRGFQAVTSGFIEAGQVTADLIEKFGEKNKESALIAFNVRKATAISETVINTALAITRALADLGPVAGPVAAGFIGATGAAQVALIAAESPKFHTGGMIGAAPDERKITAQTGEFILSRQTVNRIGADNIERMNRGNNPMQPMVIVTNPFKHYDRFVKGRKISGLDVQKTGQTGY